MTYTCGGITSIFLPTLCRWFSSWIAVPPHAASSIGRHASEDELTESKSCLLIREESLLSECEDARNGNHKWLLY